MENFSNMDKKLIENWLKEEKNAHIQGWDFFRALPCGPLRIGDAVLIDTERSSW